MPYPSQIDQATIIETARQMIEQAGLKQLSLGKLAAVLGVKAPSLYRHIGNKAELLQAVNLRTIEGLFAALAEAAAADDDPQQQMKGMLHALRNYAHTHPRTYQLAMTAPPGQGRPDEDRLVQLVLPAQAVMAKISGQARSLAALRGAQALVHGFVMLELNQQFQRGGDLNEAFEQVLAAYLAGWSPNSECPPANW